MSIVNADPADVGMDAKRLALLRPSIEKEIDSGITDGSIILVARRGKIVWHEAIGFSDKRKNRTAEVSDVLPIMSLTKQLTAALVFRFIDRGQLALTTRIAEIIPEFGQHGKERVTVRDALSHQAGLPMQHPVDDWKDGNEAYVAKICAMRPEPAPEGIANYHAGAAHAVLGEVVRRLDGGTRSLSRMMHEELLLPTRMHDTALTLAGREDLVRRAAPITMRDTSTDAIPPRDIERIAEIASTTEFLAGGAFSTAYDLLRFAEMMRNGGELDGERILSAAIIKLATTNQTGSKLNGLFLEAAKRNYTDPFPANIGLSFYVRGEGIFLTSMGTLSSPNSFAGSGFGGQQFCVDPERELSFVHLVSGYPQLFNSRKRSQRISDLIVSSVLH